MLSFGNAHKWSLCAKLSGGAGHADNQVCAATYAELYLNSPTKKATWLQAAVKQLDTEISSPASIKSWFWVDALFMAMAVYARVGAATGEQKYFEKMYANFAYSALVPHPNGFAFFSSSDALFYRDPPKGAPNGVFWSRGNGWAAAALVQALKYSPKGDPHVATYMSVFKQHMARLVQLQGADGCWRCSLTDPGEVGMLSAGAACSARDGKCM